MEEAGDDIEEIGKALSKAKEPYEFAMQGNWEGLKKFYEDNAKLTKDIVGQFTTNNDTALHVAAAHHAVFECFIKLINIREPRMLGNALVVENKHGNTVFHEVAASGNLDAAKLLWQEYKKVRRRDPSFERVLNIRNKLGETPLYRAAAFGRTKVVEYLASQVEDIDLELHFKRETDEISILHIAVIGQHFETALWLLQRYPDAHLAKRKERNGLTSLQLLAQMPSAFQAKFRKSIWKKLLYKCISLSTDDNNDSVPPNQNNDLESNRPCQCSCSRKTTGKIIWSTCCKNACPGWRRIYNMFEEMQNYKLLSKLTDLLVKEDYSWAEPEGTEKIKTFTLVSVKSNNPSEVENGADNCVRGETGISQIGKSNNKDTPLLIATCTGISQIVKKVLKAYPQAVEAHDTDNQQNTLHMAIKHRRLAIFEILENSEFITSRLAYSIDKYGNTILHHAADMGFYSVDAERVSGPAFQLQEELRWMARVAKIMPPHYAMHQNNQGKTAKELFESEHTTLLTSAKGWIKETAQSCSTVAALVATVAYAAAFTAPGGNDNRGAPVLRHSPFFITFAVSDTISLICSLTSLGTFLSILTSPFEYENFHHSLPFRLHLGFALLFFSLVSTMLTFTATVVLLIHHEKTWTTSLIYVVAFLPVSVFGLTQFPLYDQGLKFISKTKGLKYISKTIKKIKSSISICPVRGT